MNSRIRQLRHLAAALATVLTFTQAPAAEAQPPGLPGTTITVNSLADGNVVVWPGDPLPCTLRDAIRAANTNQAAGGCPAGMAPRYVSANPLRIDFIDRIVFNVGTGTPKIQLRWGLPAITEEVTIDGATGKATRIEIAGNQILSFYPVHGVLVTGTFATLKSLVVNGFSGHGIALTHVDGDGIIIVTPDKPERPEPGPGEPGDPCGPDAFPSDPSQCPGPGGDPDDDVSSIGEGGGGGNTVLNCLIGTDATGSRAVPNGTGMTGAAGIALLSPGNVIGGTAAGARNVISGNRGYGVLLDGRNNTVTGNFIGTGGSSSMAIPNQLDGVYVAGGQFANATGEIRENTIANNVGDGVDAGYNAIAILSNRIYANGGLGIERGEVGVTANDPTGFRTRPPSFPLLQTSTMSFLGGTTIFGQITQRPATPITLQFFYSTTCDPSGNGEGASYIGSITVNGGTPTFFQFTTPSIFFKGSFTATATTAHGTSEFSACLN